MYKSVGFVFPEKPAVVDVILFQLFEKKKPNKIFIRYDKNTYLIKNRISSIKDVQDHMRAMFTVDSFEKYGKDDTENTLLQSTSKNDEIFRRIKIDGIKYLNLFSTVKINCIIINYLFTRCFLISLVHIRIVPTNYNSKLIINIIS